MEYAPAKKSTLTPAFRGRNDFRGMVEAKTLAPPVSVPLIDLHAPVDLPVRKVSARPDFSATFRLFTLNMR